MPFSSLATVAGLCGVARPAHAPRRPSLGPVEHRAGYFLAELHRVTFLPTVQHTPGGIASTDAREGITCASASLAPPAARPPIGAAAGTPADRAAAGRTAARCLYPPGSKDPDGWGCSPAELTGALTLAGARAWCSH